MKNYEEVEYDLKKITRVVRSGSYFICSPPVEDTDKDLFVQDTVGLRRLLEDMGMVTCNSTGYEEDHISYRLDDINVIVVSGAELSKIEIATELCKFLNLTCKNERLAVFNAFRKGVVSSEETYLLV